jgi:hypothetical protein
VWLIEDDVLWELMKPIGQPERRGHSTSGQLFLHREGLTGDTRALGCEWGYMECESRSHASPISDAYYQLTAVV